MFEFLTLDHFDIKGKVVGVRVDINSPIENGKVVLNQRIIAHAYTIQELIRRGARVVILAHQGRFGKKDCLSLEPHAKLLTSQVKKKVQFVPEICSNSVKKKIKSMKNSEVLLLENLRFIQEEEEPRNKNNKIKELFKEFELYVLDAFSVAHRKHTSIIGPSNMPIIAGRVMEKELRSLNKILRTETPRVFVFGGTKPDDLLDLIESSLQRKEVDVILLAGVIGELALYLQGYDLGFKMKFMQEHGYLDQLKRLERILKKYSEHFILPRDLALSDGKKRIEFSLSEYDKYKTYIQKYEIGDVGRETVEYFALFLKSANSIYVKGPLGNFENSLLGEGTRLFMKKVVNSKAFSFMGGGHSVTAAKKFGFLDQFSYNSLAGGALVKFLAGKILFGVESLERSYSKFEGSFEDCIVIGSNVVDTSVHVPKKYKDITLGGKIKIEENFSTVVGGGGINVSVGLRRLGAKVAYLGKLSSESSHIIKGHLNKEKITLIPSKITDLPAAKSILLDTKDNDRVIFTYRGQNAHLEEKDFTYKDFSASSYYLSTLTGKSFSTLLKLAKNIRKVRPHAMLCFNPSSYLIDSERKLKKLLIFIDVLVLNYSEAQSLTGREKLSDCLKKCFELSKGAVVVITDGAHGAFAYDGEQEYNIKAYSPKEVVDTTGAGDAFASTFFYFYREGYGVQKALELAARNSSHVVEFIGAQKGLLRKEVLLKK